MFFFPLELVIRTNDLIAALPYRPGHALGVLQKRSQTAFCDSLLFHSLPQGTQEVFRETVNLLNFYVTEFVKFSYMLIKEPSHLSFSHCSNSSFLAQHIVPPSRWGGAPAEWRGAWPGGGGLGCPPPPPRRSWAGSAARASSSPWDGWLILKLSSGTVWMHITTVPGT